MIHPEISSSARFTGYLEVEIEFQRSPIVRKTETKWQNSQNSGEYVWDFSDENLRNMFWKILTLDGTVENVFQRTGSFKWTIDLSTLPKVKNRFKVLLPKMCKPVFLDEILYPFQRAGRDWLLESPTRILADDMGLGKSIQSIAAIEALVFEEKLDHVLLVCPNTLLINWRNELRKWSPLLSYAVFDTSACGDIDAISRKKMNNNISLIGYSALAKFSSTARNSDLSFDLIVADEAHKLRNTSSRLNRAFRAIPRERTWLLTGTPLERDEEDIRNMLACLDPGKAMQVDARVDNVILKSKLRKVSFRRLKSDVLNDLPAVQKITESLELNSSQIVDYRRTLREMFFAPPIDRIGYLTKLSYAAIVSDNGSSNKFDRAIEICDNAKGENRKVIIFSNFNNAIYSLRKRLFKRGIKSSLLTGDIEKQARNRHVSRFRTDKCITCLLCNSRLGSEGLTLTEASIVIFLNEWWNPSSNRQAEDRVNRIGQKDSVQIFVLRSNNTIDDNVAAILEKKINVEKDFLEQLASEIKGHV
jgi:SNF2 family DNA or RNA helicase